MSYPQKGKVIHIIKINQESRIKIGVSNMSEPLGGRVFAP